MFVVTTLAVDGGDSGVQKRLKSLLRTPDPEFLDTLSGGSILLAGGLVMESGRQLSHGAVVARVRPTSRAGIAGVTQLLHDGQVVLLDAFRGRSR